VAATATLAVLFIAGHYMLRDHMIRQLDQLNETQFKQLRTALGPGFKTLTPEVINQRIRDTTESASTLFYIDMHGPMTNRFFKSNNLHGQSIPDIPGERAYSTEVPGIGLLRVSEFLLPPFEVTVATPLAPVDDVMKGYVRVSVALIVLMLLVSIALGAALSQMVLRPVRVIRDTANRIRSDNLKERIPVGNVKDEVSELARLLNQMFAALARAPARRARADERRARPRTARKPARAARRARAREPDHRRAPLPVARRRAGDHRPDAAPGSRRIPAHVLAGRIRAR
jgi:HAMP domain-containing protein